MCCDAHSIPNPKLKLPKESWILTFIQTKATLYRHCCPRLQKREHNTVSSPGWNPCALCTSTCILPFTSLSQLLLYAETVKVTLQAHGLESSQGAETPFMTTYFF